MSHNIYEKNGLLVTAYVGDSGTACVQITTTNEKQYAQLTEEDTLELIYALVSRILRKRGYCATD